MWIQIKSLITGAGTRIFESGNGIIPQNHWLLSETLEKEISGCEDKIGEDDKKKLSKQIENLGNKILDFKKSRGRDAFAVEMRETSRSVLLMELESLVKDVKKAAKIETPPHFMPFEFRGIDHDFRAEDYSFCLSGTSPAYLILKKNHKEKFSIDNDGFFVVGITNCPVKGSLDIIDVERSTFVRTSIEDKEVFEAIHAIRDCYKTPFKLGILEVEDRELFEEGNGPFIKNDYNMAARLTGYCGTLEKPKTLTIIFVAELENLTMSKDGIFDIFGKIPFEELKSMGIDDFKIDILSCKTTEIVGLIENAMLTYAVMHGVKISCPVYSGYVQNNSSFCYMNTAARNAVEQDLLSTTKDEKSEISAKDFQFRNKANKEKNDTLVEVRVPGFSIFDITYEEHLKEVVVTKKIRTIKTPEQSPTSSDSDSLSEAPGSPPKSSSVDSPTPLAAAAASRVRTVSESSDVSKPKNAGTRVEKKFIAPNAQVAQGVLFQMSYDGRTHEVQKVAAASAADSGPPSTSTAKRGGNATLTKVHVEDPSQQVNS